MSYDSRDYYRPSGFGGFSFFPPVIKNLLIINAVVFFLQLITERIAIEGGIVTIEHYITRYFALIPFLDGKVFIDSYRYLEAAFFPWQIITYQFLHGDFSHIFFNMFMLWMFGMELENTWGSKKFLVFYLVCGIGGALLQLILSGNQVPTIGASGSVFGVMVAFAMFFPNRYIFLYFLVPVKAKYLIAFLVLIEFMSVGNMSIVAHLVHLGGALTGLSLVLLDKKYHLNVDGYWRNLKDWYDSWRNSGGSSDNFRKPKKSMWAKPTVEEAEYFDINDKQSRSDESYSQQEIDKILDKISESGYQNLTEREKRILFEASKKE
ncbi:MAG: rhomboid family intramembrane serine protease [Melioribacteraceae bacterium]|nr:rhomboid family intramembrane serine protease [Melioribacteraceae bacterium]MCF8266149.1 rhomboid family intramembrane serine protease [Melioribacteraceae bacterium]MCF8412026.1 rhomboid family intramembrane serine protease [Melioribacteraceae bacterium]MCF8431657.1 rhomboid family intramembrane serine protease [Melioribacteraceae bacterium]